MEVLIFYADKLIVMGNSKNSCVFNFVIILKSWKFDAREIYMFYSNYCFATAEKFIVSLFILGIFTGIS